LSDTFTFKNAVIGFLLFCSPPILLLFERGNLDSLIFILTTFSIFLFLKNRKLFSKLIITFASLSKFYSFPSMVILMREEKGPRPQRVLGAFLLVFTSAWILFDLRLIYRGFSFPNPTFAAFGSPIFGLVLNKYLHLDLSKNQELFCGFCILAGGFLLLQIMQRSSKSLMNLKSHLLNLSDENRIIYRVFAITYVFTFFTGMSFVYRLVFVLPVLYLIVIGNWSNKTILIAALSAIWFSYEVLLFEIVGDILLFAFAMIIVWVETSSVLSRISK